MNNLVFIQKLFNNRELNVDYFEYNNETNYNKY